MSAAGIDLWQFPLDGGSAAVNAALAFLGPGERAHFRQFAWAELAGAFAIRRAARRIILARYLGVDPSDVKTCDAASGKPVLSGKSAGLHFSASHSKDRGILAVTPRFPIGADVERRRRIDTRALAGRVLSPLERREFDRAEPEDRGVGIFRAWTAKEALVKGIGVGLDLSDLPLISLPITALPDVWRPVQLDGRLKDHGRWHVYSLAPSENYFVSLAAPAEAAVTAIDARGILAGQGI